MAHIKFENKTIKVPDWWECTWRRVGCGKDECPICGSVNQFEREYAHQKIRAQSKFVLPEDIDIVLPNEEPKDEEFDDDFLDDYEDEDALWDDLYEGVEEHLKPFLKLLNKFSETIHAVTAKAQQEGKLWMCSDMGQDLVWYSTLLPAKTYRQLSTIFEIKRASPHELREDEYYYEEYYYTKYVLTESLSAIQKALENLIMLKIEERETLINLYIQFLVIKIEIIRQTEIEMR